MTPIDPAKLTMAQRLQTPAPAPVAPLAPAAVAAPGRAAPAGDAGSTAMANPAAAASGRVGAGAQPPFDQERVAEIRKAVEEGRYPVVPTRIADAIIAAGYLLRVPE